MELFSTHPELPIVFDGTRQPQTFVELMQAWRQWSLEGKFSLPLLRLTDALRADLDEEGFVLEGESTVGVAVQGGAQLLVHWSQTRVRHPESERAFTMCVDWTISTEGKAKLYVEFQNPEDADYDELTDVLGTQEFSLHLEVHPGGASSLAFADWFERSQDCVGLCFAQPGGIPNLLDHLRGLAMDELRMRASA